VASYILNSTPVSGDSYLYNLSDDIIEVVSIHIEPILFSQDVSGFNEITNNSLWLLENNNISITLDGNQTFILNKDSAGRSVTNPIIYRRNNVNGKHTINVVENNISTVIQPIYGNDSTIYGSDWIRSINNTKYDLLVINSLPSSGSTVIDKQYFLNHFINLNLNDSILFQVNILPANQSIINLINQQLLKCRFVVQKALYNKQMTSGIELLYSNEFKVHDNEFGVRF
jgi:hypothetical protein